ncbi:MAG: hypothetical protein ACI4RD_03775 [Kiritimatiellia bacterium]
MKHTLWGLAAVGCLLSAQAGDRFFYASCDFARSERVAFITNLVARGAAVGYNGMVLAGGIDYLPWWKGQAKLDGLRTVKRACDERGVELIPLIWGCGYGSMIGRDRNLAEGFPLRDFPAEVRKGKLRFPSGPVARARMRFRAWDKNVRGDGPWTFANFTEKHGHSRLACQLDLEPNRRYRATMRVRERGLVPRSAFRLQGYVGLRDKNAPSKQIGGVTAFRRSDTNETATCVYEFVTPGRPDFDLIFGTWGGKRGSVTVESLTVEEIPHEPPLRRPGCPLTIRRADTGAEVAEQALKSLPDGTQLRVDCYVSQTVAAGQRSTCMSEPKLYELFDQSAAAMARELKPAKVLLSMDEIREGGTCAACEARRTDMAHILGDCVTRQHAILRRHLPGVGVYIWSDMFNPLANAHDDYYACKGTFAGSWQLIPKDIIIADWHGSLYEKSLPFWQEHGFKVLGATYYDQDALEPRSVHDVRELRKHAHVTGVMYTTWQDRYELLEPFARQFFNRP